MITTEAAARRLGWTEAAVEAAVHDGTLPAVRYPLGYAIRSAAVETWQ